MGWCAPWQSLPLSSSWNLIRTLDSLHITLCHRSEWWVSTWARMGSRVRNGSLDSSLTWRASFQATKRSPCLSETVRTTPAHLVSKEILTYLHVPHHYIHHSGTRGLSAKKDKQGNHWVIVTGPSHTVSQEKPVNKPFGERSKVEEKGTFLMSPHWLGCYLHCRIRCRRLNLSVLQFPHQEKEASDCQIYPVGFLCGVNETICIEHKGLVWCRANAQVVQAILSSVVFLLSFPHSFTASPDKTERRILLQI